MSIDQKRSIEEAKLRARAKEHADTAGVANYAVVCSQSTWLAGYKAALADARKIVDKAGGSEGNVASDIIMWLEEMPS